MVYPHLGDVQLAALRPQQIRQWQTRRLEQGYAPATVKGVRGQFAGAFNAADRVLRGAS